ncbi:MAG: trypsin-like peptidase domain-containing protein [Synergistaceae bacterium]|nr:trypsin-like peptidase domain-containing protein [Synergistaceae bacterium]
MTLEEACLYLNINPDDDDINLAQLEKNYKTKLSIYDLKRFREDSPEYREAKKMRSNIDEAYKYLLDVYAQLHEPESIEPSPKPQSDGWLLKTALCMTTLAALFLTGLVYFMNNSHQEKPAPAPVTVAPKSELLHDEKDANAKYEELRRELEVLKKRAEESQAQNKPQPQNHNNNKYSDVIEKCRPSMVFIQTDKSRGSGFLVSEHGDILTNHHVIKDAGYIKITPYDGQPLEALVKDSDSVQDMALLKVNNLHTNYLRITQTPPKLGEEVIAIGNPQGLFIDSVSNGIVSGFRTLDNIPLLQFTAPISQGSSGGAVINLNGEVVGMTKGYWREGQNLNFAVPSNVLIKFLNSAINKSARAINQPITTPRASRTPRASKGLGIPLPDAKGFLVHKWGCSVESVRRYVSAPLIAIDNSGMFFSTGRIFKAFRAKIDTIVTYFFLSEKLDSILFEFKDRRNKSSLASIITRELTELYGTEPKEEEEYVSLLNALVHRWIWYPYGLTVSLDYDSNETFLSLSFCPRK